jgi:hypothetical protein
MLVGSWTLSVKRSVKHEHVVRRGNNQQQNSSFIKSSKAVSGDPRRRQNTHIAVSPSAAKGVSQVVLETSVLGLSWSRICSPLVLL